MSQSEDRSGLNPAWVKGLVDLTPEDCHAYLDRLQDTPLGKCEAPECKAPPAYRVTFHEGCKRYLACNMHRAVWFAAISRTVQHNGSIECDVCEYRSYTAETMIEWYVI